MKKIIYIILVLAVSICFKQSSFAAEHGGKEHGGKEHGGKEHGGKEHGGKEHGGKEHGGVKTLAPSANDIRNTMKNYVLEQSRETGIFNVYDPQIGKTRKLNLIRVHERVGKTGGYYYSCADFKDVDTQELLDLDLDVEDKNGKLSVVDVRIHKVSGKERYTYDENDNRIPMGGVAPEAPSYMAPEAPSH